jgi:uncharacterized protein DUF3850
MSRHELKIWPDFFEDVRSGAKRYEIRKNDRNFQVGDELHLREYNPDSNSYSGRALIAKVEYITYGGRQPVFVLPSDFCVMGIEVIA